MSEPEQRLVAEVPSPSGKTPVPAIACASPDAYEAAKFALADVLRAGQASGIARHGEAAREAFGELFRLLAEDQFNVVVAGHFSRGKSSLLNALLGTEALPTGELPVTSVITRVTHGSHLRALISYRSGGPRAEVPVAELSTYVTESGNSANLRGISEVRIELPVRLLRNGFHFIDTPGLGSAITANTRTTELFLPSADAMLLVSSFDAAFGEDECELLRAANWYGIRCFVVLNKLDIVTPTARTDVIAYTQRHLRTMGWPTEATPFSVSAKDGLAARRRGDVGGLIASGISGLEQAILDQLVADKEEHVLRRICDRSIDVLRAYTDERTVADLGGQIDRIRSCRSPANDASAGASAAMPEATGQAPAVDSLRGCAVCRDEENALFEFLRSYQYALGTDATTRAAFVASGGFCPTHTRFYRAIATPRDMSVALSSLVESHGRDLRRGNVPGAGGECPACTVSRVATSIAVRRVIDRRDLPTSSVSLCLPHIARVAESSLDHSQLRMLLEQQAAGAERLANDMRRYALRRDGTLAGSTTALEQRAAQDAVTFLVGQPMFTR